MDSVRMLVGRLRDLLGDVHDAAIGMGFRHPGEACCAGDRLARNRAHEHGQPIDLRACRTNEVGVAGMVGKKLSEYQAAARDVWRVGH